MNIAEEWRMYDPKDIRTHPEAISRIEIEFEDGLQLEGQYSRDLSWFIGIGTWPPANSTVKRWRYLSSMPDL